MENKKIFIGIIVIVIVIVLGIYFFRGNDGNDEDSGGVLDSQSVFSSNNIQSIIESLDKERCSELDESFQSQCVSGIDFIEKAVAANDINLCIGGASRDQIVPIKAICINKLKDK